RRGWCREAPVASEAEGLADAVEVAKVVHGVGQVLGGTALPGDAHVAESGETLGRGGIRRPHRILAFRHPGQLGAKGAGAGRLLRDEVPRFARVGHEVVELRPRRMDVVPAAVGDGLELAPAELDSRIEGLSVQRALGSVSLDETAQGDAPAAERAVDSQQVEHGGGDVDETRWRLHRSPGEEGAGELHEEGNPYRLDVEEDRVLGLAAAPQALA